MQTIQYYQTEVALWLSALHAAQSKQNSYLNANLESYLACLLMRYQQQPNIFSTVIAEQYLRSCLQNTQQKHVGLQQTGDICLIYTGLFPEIIHKRHVNIEYYINIGQSSYNILSMENFRNDGATYNELSEQFIPLTKILTAIRNTSHITSASKLTKNSK